MKLKIVFGRRSAVSLSIRWLWEAVWTHVAPATQGPAAALVWFAPGSALRHLPPGEQRPSLPRVQGWKTEINRINTKSYSLFFQIRRDTSHRNIPNLYASPLLLNFLSVPSSTKAWSLGRHANCSPRKPRQQHSKRINQTWGIRILQRGSKEICDWKATHQNYSQLRSWTEKKRVNVFAFRCLLE